MKNFRAFRMAPAILGLLFDPCRLLACSCVRIAPACEAVWKADAVFVGRPESIDPLTIFGIPLMWPWRPLERHVRFAVTERFVGAIENVVEVTTGMGGGDCGIDFERGRGYLVYAYRNQTTRELYTGICTRTADLEDAVSDLGYLRSLSGNAPPAHVYGFVTGTWLDFRTRGKVAEPVVGVPIQLKSNGRDWKTVTDAEGAYDFPALPPGTFSMSADLPRHLGGGEPRVVSLHDHGCSEQILVATERASISGKVLDDLDSPVSSTVHLTPTSSASSGRVVSGYAGRDGAFTIEHVAPGEYYLGVNIVWPPSGGHGLNMPWQPTYYPGVQNKALGQRIHIDSAQHLHGFEFHLPPRLKPRTITGTVTWPSGKPAMAFVELKDNAFDSNADLANSGWDGSFTITGVVDRPYSISAVAGLGAKETPIHSAKVDLGLSANGPVHLVLSIPGKN